MTDDLYRHKEPEVLLVLNQIDAKAFLYFLEELERHNKVELNYENQILDISWDWCDRIGKSWGDLLYKQVDMSPLIESLRESLTKNELAKDVSKL